MDSSRESCKTLPTDEQTGESYGGGGGPPFQRVGPPSFFNVRICESANLRICESANPRIRESANLRICESANPRICESANLRICESANLRILRVLRGQAEGPKNAKNEPGTRGMLRFQMPFTFKKRHFSDTSPD